VGAKALAERTLAAKARIERMRTIVDGLKSETRRMRQS
jgi:hypothetical protein